MLSKYQPNFASLTQAEAALVARHVVRVAGDPLDHSRNLYDQLQERGFTQAQVILAVAHDPSPEAVVVLEKLVGKPISRESEKPQIAARPPSAPRAKGAAVRGTDKRIITSVAPNPKKEGSASHARYALYTVGMTVDEFVAAGGTTADVKWDLSKGFIALGDQA